MHRAGFREYVDELNFVGIYEGNLMLQTILQYFSPESRAARTERRTEARRLRQEFETVSFESVDDMLRWLDARRAVLDSSAHRQIEWLRAHRTSFPAA